MLSSSADSAECFVHYFILFNSTHNVSGMSLYDLQRRITLLGYDVNITQSIVTAIISRLGVSSDHITTYALLNGKSNSFDNVHFAVYQENDLQYVHNANHVTPSKVLMPLRRKIITSSYRGGKVFSEEKEQ